jgi:hypothetical protein
LPAIRFGRLWYAKGAHAFGRGLYAHRSCSSAYRLSNAHSASSTVDPVPMIPSVALDSRSANHFPWQSNNCGRCVAVGLSGCAAQYFIISCLACSGMCSPFLFRAADSLQKIVLVCQANDLNNRLAVNQTEAISRHASRSGGFLFRLAYHSLKSPLCPCVSITLP